LSNVWGSLQKRGETGHRKQQERDNNCGKKVKKTKRNIHKGKNTTKTKLIT